MDEGGSTKVKLHQLTETSVSSEASQSIYHPVFQTVFQGGNRVSFGSS